MRVIFLIIQKNEAENVSMMLNELFLAFQINFHPHKKFFDLNFHFKKIAWRIKEWRVCY